MSKSLGQIINAFWRAAAYCLHPRVIMLSLLPLLLLGGLAGVFMYFFWESAVAGVRSTLESWQLISALLDWLDRLGASGFRTVLAPLLVLALATPVIVVLSLLLVALLMTPQMARLVAMRRYPALERKHGSNFWTSLAWSLAHVLVALFLLLISMPLWLIPPLVLFIPPLIWAWLGYRVFAYDVLAGFATVEERRHIMQANKFPLFFLGLITGYLGAAPAAIWAFGALSVIFAPYLVLVSVWLYTLVFAFAALWFAHFCFQALWELRQQPAPAASMLDLGAGPSHAARPVDALELDDTPAPSRFLEQDLP